MDRFHAAMTRLRSRRGDFRGMSLIEVLIAIVLTATISGVLALVFGGVINGSEAANEQLSRSAEAERIAHAWTADVQNVDVGGVNTSVGCVPPSAVSGDSETFLVSFTWNSLSDHVGTPQSSAWVAVGSGTGMQLVRRECKAGEFVEETVLATRVGKSGQDPFEVIHGPGSDPAAFCPPVNKAPSGQPAVWVSDTCSIVVSGAFDYRLDVARGVVEPSDEYGSVLPPVAPTIADAVGRNHYVTVSWGLLNATAQRPAVDQYQLLLYTDVNQAPVAAAPVDGQTNAASIADLSNDVQYFARVQARNSVGWGPLSDPVAVTPTATGPDAPTITSTTPSDGSVMLTWTPNSNNGGFTVTSWSITTYDLNNVLVSTTSVAGGITSTTIGGLTNGDAYRLTVTGHNQAGEGLPSELSDPFVPYGAPPPAGEVYALANEGKAQVRWTPPADDNGRPIVGYVLRTYQGIDATSPIASTYLTNSAANCTSVCQVDQAVGNGAYYRFTVASRSDVGDGTTLDGAESSRSTPYPAPAVQPKNPPYVRPSVKPDTPAKPTLVVTGTNLSVTFTVPAGGGEPVQRVFVSYASKSTAPGASYGAWSQAVAGGWDVTESSGSTKTVSFTGNPGNIYKVKVAVGNKGEWFTGTDPWRLSGESPESDPKTVAGASNAPGTPTVGRSGNSYPFAASLAWTAPSNDGGACVDQYKVEYSATGSSWGSTYELFPSSPDCAAAAAAASASIYGNLLAGEGTGTRYFRVQAHNSTGWGPFSSPGSTTALRQECTLNATESKWVGQYNGSNTGGSPGGELKVRYRDSKDDKHDYWSYIKFDQRPTGTNCSEFGAPLPATAVPDGRPTGYDTGSVATYAVVIANRTSGPNSGQVAIHQAASTWDEASLTWNTKPARQSGTETDHISGGSNGARWWAVSSDYAVSQRSSNRFGWILGQKDGSDEWKFDGRSASNPPKLRIRFR